MRRIPKLLTASFLAVALLAPGHGAGAASPDTSSAKSDYDCPEIDALETMEQDNKRFGRKDPNLDQLIEQQIDACSMRYLRQEQSGPGKIYEPWEKLEPIEKNWNSPNRFRI